MPRQQRRGAFDLDRDVLADSPTPPATTEASPATGGALLPKLYGDLPPLPAHSTSPENTDTEQHAGPRGPTRGVRDASSEPGEGRQAASRPRGAGGRPSGASRDAEGGIIKVPARVPASLYDQALPLVTGIGKPSWGQLVAWTCQDHRDDVLAELAQKDQATDRRPRGQNRHGTAGLQVTARLTSDEFTIFEDAMKQAQGKTQGEVTRTKLVIAALTGDVHDQR